MTTGITIDTREFNRALMEYAVASKHDFAYILNKQLGNAAAMASSYSPIGNKSDIQALEKKKWWPAFVRKVTNLAAGFTLTMRRKAKGAQANVEWIDLPTGRRMYGRKTMGVKVKVKGWMGGSQASIANLKRVSKAIIRRRIATWKGALRAPFGIHALAFGARLGQFERKGRTFAMPRVLATPSQLWAMFVIPFKNKKNVWPDSGYGHRPTPEEDVQWKQAMGKIILDRAFDYVSKDMVRWAQGEMAKTARKYSARR